MSIFEKLWGRKRQVNNSVGPYIEPTNPVPDAAEEAARNFLANPVSEEETERYILKNMVTMLDIKVKNHVRRIRTLLVVGEEGIISGLCSVKPHHLLTPLQVTIIGISGKEDYRYNMYYSYRNSVISKVTVFCNKAGHQAGTTHYTEVYEKPELLAIGHTPYGLLGKAFVKKEDIFIPTGIDDAKEVEGDGVVVPFRRD